MRSMGHDSTLYRMYILSGVTVQGFARAPPARVLLVYKAALKRKPACRFAVWSSLLDDTLIRNSIEYFPNATAILAASNRRNRDLAEFSTVHMENNGRVCCIVAVCMK